MCPACVATNRKSQSWMKQVKKNRRSLNYLPCSFIVKDFALIGSFNLPQKNTSLVPNDKVLLRSTLALQYVVLKVLLLLLLLQQKYLLQSTYCSTSDIRFLVYPPPIFVVTVNIVVVASIVTSILVDGLNVVLIFIVRLITIVFTLTKNNAEVRTR